MNYIKDAVTFVGENPWICAKAFGVLVAVIFIVYQAIKTKSLKGILDATEFSLGAVTNMIDLAEKNTTVTKDVKGGEVVKTIIIGVKERVDHNKSAPEKSLWAIQKARGKLKNIGGNKR